MKILTHQTSSVWARRMRCLQLISSDTAENKAALFPTPGRAMLWRDKLNRLRQVRPYSIKCNSPDGEMKEEYVSHIIQPNKYATMQVNMMNRAPQDLKRFLEKVGTDAKQARYWLKEFQRQSDPHSPFAVIQIEESIFSESELLESLASSLSFLHRNDMKVVLVHGSSLSDSLGSSSLEALQKHRAQLSSNSMLLASCLESHGAPSRPLFVGTNVLQAQMEGTMHSSIQKVEKGPISWCFQSGHIPILLSVGETQSGQIVPLDLTHTTEQLSLALKPFKVMLLNSTGGFYNENGEVIPNVNLPLDLETCNSKPWCDIRKVQQISSLLHSLPAQSSVVITSAGAILTELFTHQGFGTLFKITEPIHMHTSFDEVDRERLLALFNRSFGKDLNENYFNFIEKRLNTLYLSEKYNAAAVITNESEVKVPYLDKFAVSLQSQGQGTSEMLWDCIRRDFDSLFWRSRSKNMINPWYFRRSEGSWSNGAWIVFWYGISEHKMTSSLIDFALSLSSSFKETGTGEDNTLVE
ncbi:N-acetylglutamate synthase, mitochondrial [Lingula anatina]|uniref:N-acetylglutamate synthase, mitochondrial n=1 Tax=Lingula anatina TaxID=7574 RepID=A0A1S3JQV7_LINAN|nr:N-acetylglutamate synthase, mitochondrial [Lingula anatina]|eukprot:XP_013412506.1 N-acetylglutamate synthase, mitochondrial [Lingula anatina]